MRFKNILLVLFTSALAQITHTLSMASH